MTTTSADTLSLEELSATLAAYAGPPHARTRPRGARSPWMSRRLALALALVLLIFAGCSYAFNFNPFRGISAANHPATRADKLPPVMAKLVANWNKYVRRSSPRYVLPETARFVRRLPNGMLFYAFATRSGSPCLAYAHPPKSYSLNVDSGEWDCEPSLSPTRPVTMNGTFVILDGHPGRWLGYGLVRDGITAIEFSRRLTVPVKDNVWVYLGPPVRLGPHGHLGPPASDTHLPVILHLTDRSTEKLWLLPNGGWSTIRPKCTPDEDC
jgi:hypothetical protein